MSELILAVDTALGACSAALVRGRSVLAHRLEPMQRGHAEALAPMVAAVMADAALGFGALERLAVTTGPGTFTGQRVGLAFMRGLRLALGCPLVGVTSLAAMAQAARAETGLETAVALHDARREEVYVQSLGPAGSFPQAELLSWTAALERLLGAGRPVALAGSAAPLALGPLVAAGRAVQLSTIRTPDALWIARLGAEATPAAGPPRPLYLRPADARLPGGSP